MALRSRNDPVRLFGRRLLLAGLAALVIAVALGVWNAYKKEQASAQLRAQAQAQLTDLTQQQSQLDSQVTQLQTERGMEAALRQQYALAAQGEGEVVIIDATAAPAVGEATSSAFAQWVHKVFSWW